MCISFISEECEECDLSIYMFGFVRLKISLVDLYVCKSTHTNIFVNTD